MRHAQDDEGLEGGKEDRGETGDRREVPPAVQREDQHPEGARGEEQGERVASGGVVQ